MCPHPLFALMIDRPHLQHVLRCGASPSFALPNGSVESSVTSWGPARSPGTQTREAQHATGVVTAVMVEAGFRGSRVSRLARGLRLRRAAQQTECCLGGGARRSGEGGRVQLI